MSAGGMTNEDFTKILNDCANRYLNAHGYKIDRLNLQKFEEFVVSGSRHPVADKFLVICSVWCVIAYELGRNGENLTELLPYLTEVTPCEIGL